MDRSFGVGFLVAMDPECPGNKKPQPWPGSEWWGRKGLGLGLSLSILRCCLLSSSEGWEVGKYLLGA